MNSVPLEWLIEIRDKAKEMGLETEYWVVDTIIRMWKARTFEVKDD